MNAREKILGKIRSAQILSSAGTTQAIATHLARHPRGPMPPPPADLVACFREKALKLSSDVVETNDLKEVPILLARYLGERKLPVRGVCWPSLAGLPWSAGGLEMQSRPANRHARFPHLNPLPLAGRAERGGRSQANESLRESRINDQDMVGVTGAFCAIAETGTLMLLSGVETPATTSLLPETHVAVLDPRRIVATMEDAWELMRKEYRQPPRAVNFISGPSRTADIEQTVTLGAHGPYRVLIILVPFNW
ncbi:MAG: lactate utilization protein C [Gallionella sp.]